MNTPVSFPIAKLLKEKEYKDKNMLGTVRLSEPEYYDPNGIIHNIKDIFEEKDYEIEDCFNAPTIVEVIMWLYEKYAIWIEVYYDDGKKEFYTVLNGEEYKYNSPTEAYETTIKYVLENLI